ncbi:MAG TPA: hypothetical protein VHC98_00960 [Candidatus Saccharimonadales bacterium]|nr:hypothetical protein [Candidatus Saccharimonadales bacterium]
MKRSIFYNLGRFVTRKGRQQIAADETRRELLDVVSTAHEPLFTADTVFPLTIFPDTVTIDRTKLSITHRVFFGTADVVGINIEDILNVTSHVGPVFGSIDVHTRFFDPHKPYSVNYLWRSDALKIDRILHGYSIALQNGIDCSSLNNTELAAMLDKLGQEHPSA